MTGAGGDGCRGRQESFQSNVPSLPEDPLHPGVVPLPVVAEVPRARVVPVVSKARERPCLLADIALRVPATRPEREELHELACVVLVWLPAGVVRPGEPEQHGRVARHVDQEIRERAERALPEAGRSAAASASGSRPRRSRSRTSRARRASCARRGGAASAPCGRATRDGRGPTRPVARARCRRRRGGRPGEPSRGGDTREATAFLRPSFASFSAWPRLGPKPARQRRRSASRRPNDPL